MKTIILVTLLSGVTATGIFAQGTIAVDNLENSNPSPSAQSGGLFFNDQASTVLFDAPTLNIEVFGGSNASSLSPIVTLAGTNSMVYGGAPGQYADRNGLAYTIPGVPSQGTAYLEIEVWTGSDLTFAQAEVDGSLIGGSGIFQNPTGGPGIPPMTPQDLVGMPAILIPPPGPEPSTIAIGGVGAVALLLFYRRK